MGVNISKVDCIAEIHYGQNFRFLKLCKKNLITSQPSFWIILDVEQEKTNTDFV